MVKKKISLDFVAWNLIEFLAVWSLAVVYKIAAVIRMIRARQTAVDSQCLVILRLFFAKLKNIMHVIMHADNGEQQNFY